MKDETIADIVREIQIYIDECNRGITAHTRYGNGAFPLDDLIKRIKAAHERETVTDCNALNTAKAREVVAKWRDHLRFKFANGFGIDSAADIGRDMLACLDEIKQSISTPLNKVIYNGEDMREADDWLNQLVRLINGEINHYMSQGADCFSVDCGPWHIKYDNTKGESNE